MPFGGYMSLVIYKDGLLVGDRHGSRYVASFDMVRDVVKLYKSKCGRIALAVTGQVLTDEDLQKAFDFFINSVTDYHYRHLDLDYNNRYAEEDALRMGMTGRHFMIMTRSHIFAVEAGMLIDLSNEPWYATGSGQVMADIFLTAGYSPQKTIENVSKINQEVSKRFTLINQATLKPLIKEVV